MVIAPHPFFPHPKFISLGGRLLRKYANMIDAVEHTSYYTQNLNFNAPAVRFAKEYKKPLVGNSDLHNLRYMGTNYSLIKAGATIDSVIKAIKSGNVEVKTNPILVREIIIRSFPMMLEAFYNLYLAAQGLFKKKNL